MKVVLTAQAKADLIEIGDRIAEDNPRRAGTFVSELLRAAREIGTAPKRFQLVERYALSGVRRRVHGNYLIFYRIEARQVTVLHILHGARDYEALLGGH